MDIKKLGPNIPYSSEPKNPKKRSAAKQGNKPPAPKTWTEQYHKMRAELAELELHQKRATLVSVADVEAIAFTRDRTIRAAMEALPGRCSGLLIGVDDQRAIERTLSDEIRQLLIEIDMDES